ncbi:hypothetical protein OO014_03755 [Intrasporangium calvum]|uniref:Uncharacterized protein n=1 Tax=Intrasporangium calvum TaxID=53358 RepID=A0ABT5GDL5_9MICO|nr:hypothetical protein [Intrasporangium calvum]MDC5696359.1 hypothetical protein [Intrasporangium calvum]
MNTLERRVTDALHEQVDELPISTKDLAQLQRELHRRARGPELRDRRWVGSRPWQLVVAACAVTGVVLGVLSLRSDPEPPKLPAGPGPITLTELAGVWKVQDPDNPWLWIFGADGTLTHSDGPDVPLTPVEGTAWTVTPVSGGFQTVNDTARWRTGDGVTGAGACIVTWGATLSTEGRMQGTVKQAGPTCQLQPSDEVWEWIRISPASIAGTNLSPHGAITNEEILTGTTKLFGTWLLKGTGKVLAVQPSATGPGREQAQYTLYDFGVAAEPETGTVRWQTDGWTFVLTPDQGTCSAVYEKAAYRTSTMVATLAVGSCARLGGAIDTWIRLN